MGGNGSGKSTLVRALIGAVPASSGTIEMFGEAPYPHTFARIGYVPQRVSAAAGVAATGLEVVISGMLGTRRGHSGENVGLSLLHRLRPPRDATERALSTLDQLGIANLARRNVATLSGGQQQRVLIARALVRNPDLLILDEPMAGVDLPSQEALAEALRLRKSDGVGVIIVLHEIGALKPLIDRAVVLDHGCVVYEGVPPAALGVHALPGHDHVHPHASVEPDVGPIDLEVRA